MNDLKTWAIERQRAYALFMTTALDNLLSHSLRLIENRASSVKVDPKVDELIYKDVKDGACLIADDMMQNWEKTYPKPKRSWEK